jgi:hypothetical protein
MAEPAQPDPPPPTATQSISNVRERELLLLADRAETLASGLFIAGVLLLIIGLVLLLFRGSGLACVVLGGGGILAGFIENVRAEVLRVRAKLEDKKD